VVAAGYAALLSRLTGADDLLIAVPVAARTRAETEPVVGPFVNTVAIRADRRGNPTLGQLVGRLHAANARAQPHQELPFARVAELSHPERQLSRSPLVQVMCVVEDAWPVLDRGGLRWRPELTDNGTGKFELELTMVDGPAGLDGRLRYRTDLFDPQTARRLADGLRMVLAVMAGQPSTPVSEVDILPPDVRELVTRTWPAAAACTGDRVVIRGSDAEFTGAQLRGRAEAIAAGLSALGVRVQDTVGILLPRGARPLAALLGVWWLGAAYVPIDPAQPPARIRGMLADAGVRALVCDRAALGPLLSELGGAVPVLDLAGRPETVDGPGAPRQVPPAAAANVLFTSGSQRLPPARYAPR
jgi:non-ribosomal peptide synthetase component F